MQERASLPLQSHPLPVNLSVRALDTARGRDRSRPATTQYVADPGNHNTTSGDYPVTQSELNDLLVRAPRTRRKVGSLMTSNGQPSTYTTRLD